MKKKKFQHLNLNKINVSYLSSIKAGNGGDEDGGVGGEEPPRPSLLCTTRNCSIHLTC